MTPIKNLTTWSRGEICLYTVSQKNKTANSCPHLHQILTDFQNSFTGRLSGKFAMKSYLNIPPHLKNVATLPCEIRISENWRQSEIRIVTNEKSQGNIAKHLRCDELFCYTFIIQSSGERIFQIGEHLAKLRAKWLTVLYAPSA